MRIQITAGGIYGADGELPIGTRLDVAERPAGWEGRFIVLGDDGENAELITGDDGENAELITGEGGNGGEGEGGDEAPVGPFSANDTGGGWWTVTDSKGQVVGKKLRAADAETFNAMSDEGKAEFLKGEA